MQHFARQKSVIILKKIAKVLQNLSESLTKYFTRIDLSSPWFFMFFSKSIFAIRFDIVKLWSQFIFELWTISSIHNSLTQVLLIIIENFVHLKFQNFRNSWFIFMSVYNPVDVIERRTIIFDAFHQRIFKSGKWWIGRIFSKNSCSVG